MHFSASKHATTEPFQIVHSDIWGPPHVVVDGYRYYIHFIDDNSKFT